MLNSVEIRELRYVPGRTMARHAHGLGNITLVLGGQIRETTSFDSADAGACSVVIKPPGVTHANVVGPRGCVTRSITFDSDDALNLPGGRSLPYGWHHGGPVAAAAIELFGAADRATQELAIVHLIESADGSRDCDRCADRGVATRTRNILRDRFREPFSSADLAEELGVHRVYLARAFRRWFGVTMHRYIHGLRVRAAADLLAAGDRSIAAIATDLGFADQAHLCRVFRAELRTTPRAYRALAQ